MGLVDLVAGFELEGSPDERLSPALTQLVHRGPARAGPSSRPHPLKRPMRFPPVQPHMIALGHGHVRAQALVEREHGAL